MSSTPFGEHLRRERELRGVSLDEVAAATRIKTSFLEALENGRWEELPGGAFNRGFIRATARFLGLDEDGMVAEYALETGTAVQNKPNDDAAGAMPRDYRPAIIVASIALLIIIAGAWLGHHFYWVHKQKRQAAAQAATAQTNAPDSAASSAPADGESPTQDAASMVSAAPAGNPGASQPPVSAANGTPPVTPLSKTAAVPDTLKLKVEASKKADVKIVGDGKTLFKGRLHSGQPKVFEAKDSFEVTSGEAGRVHLELNGQAVPFAASNGRKGAISLSRKDLKPAAEASR
jgi:cytoskeleton protein RodZ